MTAAANVSWMPFAAAITYFLTSAFAAALGFLTPLRRRDSPTGFLFQGITLAAAAWFGCFGMAAIATRDALIWARLGAIAALLLPVCLYQFTATALGIKDRRRVTLVLFWSFTFFFALLAPSTDLIVRDLYRSRWGLQPLAGDAGPYVLLGVAVILLAALWEYWREYKVEFLPAQRARMRAWMITFAIPLLVFVDAAPAYGLRVYPMGALFVMLFLLLAVYVFRRYWLVNITPSFAAREIVQTMADGVVVCDAAGRIQVVNRALLALTGYTEAQLIGQFLYLFLDPEATLADSIRLKRVLSGEKVPDRETLFRDCHGRPIDVSLSIGPIGDQQTTAGAVLIVRDIRERKNVEEILRKSEERYRQFVERSLAGVFRMTMEGTILEANNAFARIVGYAGGQELVGRSALVFYDDPGAWESALQQVRSAGFLTGLELRLRRADGSIVWVLENVSAVTGEDTLEGTMIDITDRKVAAQQIEFQAWHDSLTNLPNRRLFMDRATMAIAQSRRSEKPVGFMFVDLDRFKFINDTFGHAAGDRILVTVAERITASLRASDTVARIGGDELAVLLTELRDPSDAGVVAQKIVSALEEPVSIENRPAHVSASIGIALYPLDGDDPESLLKHADEAMYRAKQAGRNNFQLCTSDMKKSALERIELEQLLRGALVREEFVLHYQPAIELATSRVVLVEALLRWNHPSRGLLSPDAFIAVAEDTNLIVPIGRWVMRSAFMQLQQWHRDGFGGLRLAFNLSPRQFQQPDLSRMIGELLDEVGVDPRCLECEITESTAMTDVNKAITVLSELRAKGMTVAIDDFGIGHSSLNYLHQLPIDAVKIDRSFTQALTTGGNSAIVDAVIAIARSLTLRVIAEGVETEQQLAELAARHCHEAQGYLFSRPLPAGAIAPLLSDRQPKKPARRIAKARRTSRTRVTRPKLGPDS